MKGIQSFINRNCDREGKIKDGILTANLRDGANEMRIRVTEKNLSVIETDKSNIFSVMKPDTYIAAMKDHVINNKALYRNIQKP